MNLPRLHQRRQRRHSYQPRATPWVNRANALASAESAIHKPPMRQAVGLQPNQMVREPRALPWAVMKQAVGPCTTIPLVFLSALLATHVATAADPVPLNLTEAHETA